MPRVPVFALHVAFILVQSGVVPHWLEITLVALHVLGATVWVGGTIALTFIAVPAIRVLTGEPRADGDAPARAALAPDRLERAAGDGRNRRAARVARPPRLRTVPRRPCSA